MRNKLVRPLALVTLLLFVAAAVPLRAHALLLSATPPSQATVHGTVHVQLRFNARIDAKRSRLVLIQPSGGDRLLDANQPSPDTLTSDVPKLEPGAYIIRWQVLAEDGHITRGDLQFESQ
jgi:methionine-rich copper-binding protein CopC